MNQKWKTKKNYNKGILHQNNIFHQLWVEKTKDCSLQLRSNKYEGLKNLTGIVLTDDSYSNLTTIFFLNKLNLKVREEKRKRY